MKASDSLSGSPALASGLLYRLTHDDNTRRIEFCARYCTRNSRVYLGIYSGEVECCVGISQCSRRAESGALLARKIPSENEFPLTKRFGRISCFFCV